MPHQISWLVEGRVMFSKVSGVITIDEMKQHINESIALMKQGTPLIHHLIDITEMSQFPLKLNELSAASRFEEGMGWLLLVGDVNPIIRFVASVITQISKVRFRIFKTMPEATTFLEEVDATLKDRLKAA